MKGDGCVVTRCAQEELRTLLRFSVWWCDGFVAALRCAFPPGPSRPPARHLCPANPNGDEQRAEARQGRQKSLIVELCGEILDSMEGAAEESYTSFH